MKACDYCGKENDDMLAFCAGCGTVLKVTEETQTEPLRNARSPRILNAGSATVILLAYLAVQVFGGIFIGIASAVSEAQGIQSREQIIRVLAKLTPAIIGLIPLFGGVIMVLVSFSLIPKHLKDTSPNGAAWVTGRWLAVAKGLVVGVIIGTCFCIAKMFIRSHVNYSNMEPLDRMAFTTGLPQILWVIVVVFLAPPTEELLFRGVLYGGYQKSFGPIRAVVLTTVIFIIMHLPEVVHFPASAIGLAGLALAALSCRLRSAAIGPAIAVHVGYNASIAFVFLALRMVHTYVVR
jgi:membrane protease YdiL (CAAX protease family)